MTDIKLDKEILYFEEIDSTNKYGKKNIEKLKNGTVIWAKAQTDGVGRLNRVWESKEGKGLYFSIIFKNDWSMEKLSSLTNLIAYSVSRALLDLSVVIKIKWPNDLYLNDKKICGILVENLIINGMNNTIIGIGVNVNQTLDDFPLDLREKASSILMESGLEIRLEDLLLVLLTGMEEVLFKEVDLGTVIDYIKGNSFSLGKEVDISIGKDRIKGRALDILEDGSLLVDILGEKKVISFGEIINQ